MAIARAEVQITWSAASSVSVTAGSNQTSDIFTPAATAIAMSIECKADNAGTPAAGHTVDFYLQRSNGDPDGASTDEYETTLQALHLCNVDTNVTDPAIRVAGGIPVDFLSGRIYAINNAANSCTVSATACIVTA